jgi:hypothetical protein
MSVNAALGVMRIFFIWTPGGLVLKHIESVGAHFFRNLDKILAQKFKIQETFWNIIILDT